MKADNKVSNGKSSEQDAKREESPTPAVKDRVSPTCGIAIESATRQDTYCSKSVRWWIKLVIVVGVLSSILGGGATWFAIRSLGGNHSTDANHSEHESSRDTESPEKVVLPKDKWPVAGIRIKAVQNQDIARAEWVTGRVALNTDRVAQIDPLVEGIVHKVNVRFGESVAAGQTLAVIDSREVGQAKLQLFQNRLASRLAANEAEWQQEIEGNVQALIEALNREASPAELEKQFDAKPMGTYREQLVSAYARLLKSRADENRLRGVSRSGAVPEADYLAAKATYESDQATLQSLQEQIRYSARQSRTAAEQALEQARTTESISETNLRIMGLPDHAAEQADPTKQGEAVSHYPIKAPFAGTITEKDIVLMERVGPTSHLFTIADLRTVWITADIYERHLPMITGLQNTILRIRSGAWPHRLFEARVFTTGSIISDQSRTLPLFAVAENDEHLLTPGMFVEVELPGEDVSSSLVVPNSALLEHENMPFVFVYLQDDEFERRDVKVGREFDEATEILAGLMSGEHIAVEGGFFLKSQMLAEQFADDD